MSHLDSYILLSRNPFLDDGRHKAKVAENAYFSYCLLEYAPDQANDAIREKAKEWKDG